MRTEEKRREGSGGRGRRESEVWGGTKERERGREGGEKRRQEEEA